MSLLYILQGVAAETGGRLDHAESKTALKRLVNRAAKELYESTDLPGSIDELTIEEVTEDQVALPWHLGEIRAVRLHDQKDKIEIRDLRRNYGYINWPEEWLKFRVKNESPLNQSYGDEAPLKFVVEAVETPNIVVTVKGPAQGKTSTSETVTINAVDVSTSTVFTDTPLYIKKSAISSYDVSIRNLDDEEVGFIPNNQLESRFILVDVSTYFAADCLDILYKKRLTPLENDDDEYICPGFDDAIVFKAIELWLTGQPKMEDRAILYFRKCRQVVEDRINHMTGAHQKELTFAPNAFLNLYARSGDLIRKR